MREDRRKDLRRRARVDENINLKKTLYISGGILLLGIVAFFVTIAVYNSNLDKIYSDLETTSLSKTVEETNNPEEEIQETSAENEEVLDTSLEDLEEEEEVIEIAQLTEETAVEDTKEEVIEEEEEELVIEKEPEFVVPVEGEIIREYAKDNLVYSETLKEWVTHLGIDIQAEKATVVKSAAERNCNCHKK